LRSSWRWLRRKQEDEMMANTRSQMANAWRDLSDYFAEVAKQYEEKLEQLQIARLQEQLLAPAAPTDTAVASPTPPANETPDV
jgi:hypothetical protein